MKEKKESASANLNNSDIFTKTENQIKDVMGKKKSRKLFPVLVLVVIVASLALSIYLANKRTQLDSDAEETASATVSVLPTTATLDGSQTQMLQVNIDPQLTPVVFSSIEINFDQSLLRIVSEPTINSAFQRIIRSTTMADGNNTGKIVIAAAINPGTPGMINPFDFVSIQFESNTTASLSTQVTINSTSSNTMVVTDTAKPFSITTTNSELTLNPIPTNTPTPTPTIRPTATPTTVVVNSCASYCRSQNYSTGTCRQNAQQCSKNNEVNASGGNSYCQSGKNSECCCR
jgi:hypothetical protein